MFQFGHLGLGGVDVLLQTLLGLLEGAALGLGQLLRILHAGLHGLLALHVVLHLSLLCLEGVDEAVVLGYLLAGLLDDGLLLLSQLVVLAYLFLLLCDDGVLSLRLLTGCLCALLGQSDGGAAGIFGIHYLTVGAALCLGELGDLGGQELVLLGKLAVFLRAFLVALHERLHTVAGLSHGPFADVAAVAQYLYGLLGVGLELVDHAVGLLDDLLDDAVGLQLLRVERVGLNVLDALLQSVLSGLDGFHRHLLDGALTGGLQQLVGCLHATGVVLHRGLHVLQLLVQRGEVSLESFQSLVLGGYVAQFGNVALDGVDVVVQVVGLTLQGLHCGTGCPGVDLEANGCYVLYCSAHGI